MTLDVTEAEDFATIALSSRSVSIPSHWHYGSRCSQAVATVAHHVGYIHSDTLPCEHPLRRILSW